MQHSVAQGLVGDVALDRLGQHVRRRLQEMDVLRSEVAGVCRVDIEHAKGVLLSVDHHGETAAKTKHPQHWRHREPPLFGPVADDHVQAGLKRSPRVGVARRGDASAGARHLALESCAEAEAAAIAPDLPDAGTVHPFDPFDQGDSSPHQRIGVPVLQGPLAELGDDCLLGGGTLHLLLGELSLRDVVEDAVPDRHPVFVGLQHRLVEDPDDVAPPRDHPVVDRRRVAFAEHLPRLLGESPLPVIGVQRVLTIAPGRTSNPRGYSRGSPRPGG